MIARYQAGVDVTVIFRHFPLDAEDVLEGLQDYGFPMDAVRVQPRCHTKGIVVDRKRVLLGNQNWSNHGVPVNRNASLLFDNAELGEYFVNLFEHDWDVLAGQDVGGGFSPIELAPASAPTPPGMVRVTGKDYAEML